MPPVARAKKKAAKKKAREKEGRETPRGSDETRSVEENRQAAAEKRRRREKMTARAGITAADYAESAKVEADEAARDTRIPKKKAAPLRAKPKKAAKKPTSTASAAAHRGAVRAGFVPGSAMYREYVKQPKKKRAKKTGKKGTRARFEGRVRVWMREAMADQGAERAQYIVDFEQKAHGFLIVMRGVEPWERGIGRKMSNALRRVGKRFNKYAVSRIDDPEKQSLTLEKNWRASAERARDVKLDQEYFERPTYGYR